MQSTFFLLLSNNIIIAIFSTVMHDKVNIDINNNNMKKIVTNNETINNKAMTNKATINKTIINEITVDEAMIDKAMIKKAIINGIIVSEVTITSKSNVNKVITINEAKNDANIYDKHMNDGMQYKCIKKEKNTLI